MIDDTQFRTLAERSHEMQCIVNRNGCFIYVNPAWTRVLGWFPDEMVGSKYIDFVHPDEKTETKLVAEAHLNGENVFGFINRYRSKGGPFLSLQWWSEASPDGLIYASAHDITEVQRSSSRAAEIEEVSGVCSWELDMDTQAVYWSPGTMRLIGWNEGRQPTLDEAYALIEAEGLAVLQPAIANLMETG